MKILICFFLSFQIFAFNIEGEARRFFDFEIQERRPLLDDEIWLKERLRIIEGTQINHGQIRGHKVGNGFQFPDDEPQFDIKIKCDLGKDGEFLFLETKKGKRLAVMTSQRDGENQAEFLDINELERSVGFKDYQFTVGHNPLRGEMFQVEWLEKNTGLLRLVKDNELSFYLILCQI